MHALTLWIYTLVSSLAVAEGPLPPWAMGYGALAASIARAAEARPLPGEHGVDRMAALLVAIAYRESRFRADAVGDGGASLGPFQVSRAWVRPTSDLNGEADLAARLVLDSWRVCARPSPRLAPPHRAARPRDNACNMHTERARATRARRASAREGRWARRLGAPRPHRGPPRVG